AGDMRCYSVVEFYGYVKLICTTMSVPRVPINNQRHFIYQSWPLPPSIFTAVPLTYDAKSEQRKVITFAASDVSPIRPSGMLSALEAENSSHDKDRKSVV